MAATEADQALRPGELLKLQGLAIPLDKVSGNGRKYVPESVHMQVAELQPRIAKKALFGCLDHPPTDDLNQLAYVKMTDVSHRIDALWYDDKQKAYFVKVTVLDTPNGRILKAIHDAGSPLYVSLRSLLDPSKNVQRNGYIDAWMLALITIDFVSRPGFADAELEAIDVSNEAALAVCESLNLFNSQRIFDMKQNNNRKYVPVIALESVTGVQVEPSKEFGDRIKLFIADMLSKLPGKFSTQDFATAYPSGMFGDNVIGLYEDTAELMIQDADGKVTAMIELESPVDGEYMLLDDAQMTCYQNGVVDYSNEVEEEPATEMYAVVATEDYEPSEEFIATANKVASYLRDNYDGGFTQDEFNTDIAPKLEDEFGVATRIDTEDDQEHELKLVDKEGNHGASILLTIADDKMIPKQISEYWMPGTEALEPGCKVKLVDKEGEVIAEGELQSTGTYGELKETIEAEDAEGAQNMAEAGIGDDAEVYKIDGDWYYIEDGMTIESVECDDMKPEAEEEEEPECSIVANESEVEVVEETKPLAIDKDYMETSNLDDAEELSVEVIDDDDEALHQQQAISSQMYSLVEETEVETKHSDEVPKDEHEDNGKPKDNTAKSTDEDNDADMSEIAEEAQRIFGMPNSKFAGNYAIEHMPAPYKHIWAGLSDAAKSVVAKQAMQANIANESQNLAFWAKTNFVAVERACILGKGQVEAALEHITVPDPLKSFLGAPLPSAK